MQRRLNRSIDDGMDIHISARPITKQHHADDFLGVALEAFVHVHYFGPTILKLGLTGVVIGKGAVLPGFDSG